MLAAGFASGLLVTFTAEAGQFKTLNDTVVLPAGGQVEATSSPKNTNPAMEMEVYEWQTAPAGGTWQCQINFNGTGTTLSIHLIGLTGLILNSCSASPGGSCATSPIALGGSFRFMCLVATGAGSPVVGANPTYRMAVRRAS